MRCRLVPERQGINPVFWAKTFTFALIKDSTVSAVFDLPPCLDSHILSHHEINNDKKKMYLRRCYVQFLEKQFFW